MLYWIYQWSREDNFCTSNNVWSIVMSNICWVPAAQTNRLYRGRARAVWNEWKLGRVDHWYFSDETIDKEVSASEKWLDGLFFLSVCFSLSWSLIVLISISRLKIPCQFHCNSIALKAESCQFHLFLSCHPTLSDIFLSISSIIKDYNKGIPCLVYFFPEFFSVWEMRDSNQDFSSI